MSNGKVTEIEMNDGSKKNLADLKESDLGNVKLTIKDGLGNLTLKSCVLSEDAEYIQERRLFKWTTMPAISMYTLAKPKTMASFKKLGKTEKEILAYGVGNYAIEADKDHSGIITTKQTPESYVDKLYKSLVASGVPEEAAKATILDVKTSMKEHGFFK